MPAADVEEEPGSVEQTDAAPELELEPEPEPEPKLIVEALLVRFHPSNKKLLAFLKRRETEDLWESTTFDVLANSKNVDATSVQLVCTPEMTVLAARQQLAEALGNEDAADVEQIPRRWGGADLEDTSLLSEAPVLQGCAAARLVLPVLLPAERPFVIHPMPKPRSDATDEEVAAIGILFEAAESVQVNGEVAVSELDKLLEEPAEELQAFAPTWRQLLAAAGSTLEEGDTEQPLMLSMRAFLLRREEAIASANDTKTEGEQVKVDTAVAETETSPSPIPTPA